MSLNGLENPQILEAFEAAIVEPGGWFLLKYSTRDEVELLSRGNGGIAEVRTGIEQYEEDEPLYGFLKYRRRNVIIKYLPEDCSRLIQARVAVHFNAVCDKFSPYDTTIDIATAKSLTDHKLSAACSLHTASNSTSSSISSRKKRLVEIAEEEEDDLPPSKRKSLVTDVQSPKSPPTSSWSAEPVTLNSELASSPEQSKFSADTTTDVPKFTGVDERPTSSDSIGADSTLDYTYLGYPYSKPKVKLGPRPSVDSGGRPQTAGNFRPVSAIPSGYKLFGKGKRNKSKDNVSPSSTQEEIASLDFAEIASHLTVEQSQDHQCSETMRPNTSSGHSAISVAASTASTKKTISPEKARLMKAMKMRREKKQAAANTTQATDPVDASEEAVSPSAEAPEIDTAPSGIVGGVGTMSPQGTVYESVTTANLSEETIGESEMPIVKQDSGVVLDAMSASAHTDQISDVTVSEPAQSTKASSISESTEEIGQEKHDVALNGERTASTESTPVSTIQGDNGDNGDNDAGHNLGPATLSVEHLTNGEGVEQPELLPAIEIHPSNSTLDAKDKPVTNAAVVVPPSYEVSVDLAKADGQHITAPAGELDKPVNTVASGESSERKSSDEYFVEKNVLGETTTASNNQQISESKVDTDLIQKEKQRRRGVVEPIRTDVAQQSRQSIHIDGNLLDDDDLMEELQSATVEEARPMILAKTPLTPGFPNALNVPGEASGASGYMVRTISSPSRPKGVPPADVSQSTARSLSSGAAYLHNVAQQQGANNLSLKSNVGSSISQRIKALEKLSASSGTDAVPTNRGERPSSTFFSVKKREPSKSPSVIERANSLRHNPSPSPAASRDISPDTGRTSRGRSGSIGKRMSMFQPDTTSNTSDKTESISVTARIIRDPQQSLPHEAALHPSGFNPLDLKQSPLFVNHQKAASPPERVATPVTPVTPVEPQRTNSDDSNRESKDRRTSLSIVRGFMKDRTKTTTPTTSPAEEAVQSNNPSSSLARRLSIGSRNSFSKDRELVVSPSKVTESPSSADDNKSIGDGKMSRAGRFMKRLSTLSGSRGKVSPNNMLAAPSTVQEESLSQVETSRPSTTGTSPWIISYMGDVNVQFPDSLLWKRRNMCLDSQGFIVLSALPAQSSRAAQGTKRFHLSEFKAPYAPEVEMQELPNSVVLDFVEGTSLQLACEDRAGQKTVLKTLQEAHGKHADTFGQ